MANETDLRFMIILAMQSTAWSTSKQLFDKVKLSCAVRDENEVVVFLQRLIEENIVWKKSFLGQDLFAVVKPANQEPFKFGTPF